MPEFDVPGSAAVFHDRLDHNRHTMPFRGADIHSSGLSFVIDQNEVVLDDGGRYDRIGFSGRCNQRLGCQLLLFFLVQQIADLLL